ncbi:MAG: hypothetical protein JSV00_02005 [bacterium]|nr:MAG: hypothetical protein JSV00_02005 [bacterium]
MSETYTVEYTVRPYESDYRGRARTDVLLHYLQDAAFGHSLRLGFGVGDLLPRGLTWVLSRYHVRIQRHPAAGETVRISTWYPGSHGPFHLRDWMISGEGAATLVLATSSWLMIDLKTRKPTDDHSLLARLPSVDRRAIEDPFAPLPEPGGADHEVPFHVRRSDTDLNRHVNHINLIRWAMEALPGKVTAGLVPASIEAGYRAEAGFGDVVVSRAAVAGNGVFHHQLLRQSDGKELARIRTGWARGEPGG